MRSRVRSTRKKQEVFKWTKCKEDFVHGQLGYCPPFNGTTPRERFLGPLTLEAPGIAGRSHSQAWTIHGVVAVGLIFLGKRQEETDSTEH